MKLIDDWHTVLGRAWSSRLMLMSVVLQFAPATLPFMGMLPDETRDVIPRWAFIWVPIALLVLAVIARLVEQPEMKARMDRKKHTRNLKRARLASSRERRAKRMAAAKRLIAEERAERLVEGIYRRD